LVFALPGGAQERRTMIRLLRTGADFRVRVQAAFALGNTHDATARRPLERALRDDNPAVRAAAATGLGRLGRADALPALRSARADRSAAVRMQVERSIRTLSQPVAPTAPTSSARPMAAGGGLYPSVSMIPRAGRVNWSQVRYVVILGDMANRSGFGDEVLGASMRREVALHLNVLRGIATFPEATQLNQAAQRQISRRHIPALRLDGSVASVERRARRRDVSVRCEVSMMLLAEPGRSLRGMLRGAATGSEPRQRNRRAQEARLTQEALSAAVRSAMSGVATAISRAAGGPSRGR